MTTEERLHGYVVGSTVSRTTKETVWAIRVKEPENPLNDQKLKVASVHDNIQLAKGLNVTFVLGTVDGNGGQKVPKAVDVRLD